MGHLHRQLVESGRREPRSSPCIGALAGGIRMQHAQLLLQRSLARRILLRLRIVAVGVAALAQRSVHANDCRDGGIERLIVGMCPIPHVSATRLLDACYTPATLLLHACCTPTTLLSHACRVPVT